MLQHLSTSSHSPSRITSHSPQNGKAWSQIIGHMTVLAGCRAVDPCSEHQWGLAVVALDSMGAGCGASHGWDPSSGLRYFRLSLTASYVDLAHTFKPALVEGQPLTDFIVKSSFSSKSGVLNPLSYNTIDTSQPEINRDNDLESRIYIRRSFRLYLRSARSKISIQSNGRPIKLAFATRYDFRNR